MSNPRPDPPRLAAIRERLGHTTSGGRWTAHGGTEDDTWSVGDERGGQMHIAQMVWRWDAQFIAHAPEDIAHLLTDRDQLLSDLRTLETQYRRWSSASTEAGLPPTAFDLCANHLAALLARLAPEDVLIPWETVEGVVRAYAKHDYGAEQILAVLRRAAPPPARAEATEGAEAERWRLAGERVGVVYGCDTPDWMAETILGLRADNARLTQALEQAQRPRPISLDGLWDENGRQRESSPCEVDQGDSLVVWYDDLVDFKQKLEAERDQQAGALVTLREALEPFARMADAYDPDEGDGLELAWDKRPTIGQLRQARATLAASAPEAVTHMKHGDGTVCGAEKVRGNSFYEWAYVTCPDCRAASAPEGATTETKHDQ